MSSNSPTIAGPLGDCCFTGVQHTGTPLGTIATIGDIETYISEPKASEGSKKIIFFFADIHGPLFVNNQLLQDYFASHGFIVLGPEYFFGDLVGNHTEAGFDRAAWSANARKRAADALPKWIDAVKLKYGSTDTKYFAAGYCFGAPFVLQQGATDLLSAAAIAHPAFLDENHFKNLKVPLILSCAEKDQTFPLDRRRRAEDILIKNKASYHFQVFSGVSHGFAVRGDPEIEHIRWAKEESARGIIGWFVRFGAL